VAVGGVAVEEDDRDALAVYRDERGAGGRVACAAVIVSGDVAIGGGDSDSEAVAGIGGGRTAFMKQPRRSGEVSLST
jgi:hypothetical protein